MKKINDVKNWGSSPVAVWFTGCIGTSPVIKIELIRAATRTPQISPTLRVDESDLTALLGACWSCAVAIRESTVMPAMESYSDIKAVHIALMDHLGPELFELFLRPNNRVGLPPKQ